MITFDEVIQKEMSSLLYPPITTDDSIGKTIKEIKKFSEQYGFVNSRWCVFIFTDGTALYLDGSYLEATIYFSRLTYSYTDRDSGEIRAFIQDTGNTFIDQGLIDETILNDAVKMLKEYRVLQFEIERVKEIEDLQKQLEKLKNR